MNTATPENAIESAHVLDADQHEHSLMDAPAELVLTIDLDSLAVAHEEFVERNPEYATVPFHPALLADLLVIHYEGHKTDVTEMVNPAPFIRSLLDGLRRVIATNA